MTLVPFVLLSNLFAGSYYETIKITGDLYKTPLTHIVAYLDLAAAVIGIIILLKYKKTAYLYGITVPFIVSSILILISYLFKISYPKLLFVSHIFTDLSHILPYQDDTLMIYHIIICPVIAGILLILSIVFTIIFKTKDRTITI